MRERKFIVRKGIFQSYDFIVVSPGGVATTALMQYISQFVEINDWRDWDGLKHLPNPQPLRGCKIVFICADPDRAIPSLVRRGFARAQLVKLTGAWRHIFTRESRIELKLRRAILDQQRKFREADECEVLFLHGSSLSESAAPLARFLKVEDSRFVADFPIYSRD